MATKERSTRETGACVRDCQSYRVKPVVFQSTQFLIQSISYLKSLVEQIILFQRLHLHLFDLAQR